MSLTVSCPVCNLAVGVVKGLSQEPCPRCGSPLGVESDTAEWEIPPELRQPGDWEDPDIVEE